MVIFLLALSAPTSDLCYISRSHSHLCPLCELEDSRGRMPTELQHLLNLYETSGPGIVLDSGDRDEPDRVPEGFLTPSLLTVLLL